MTGLLAIPDILRHGFAGVVVLLTIIAVELAIVAASAIEDRRR